MTKPPNPIFEVTLTILDGSTVTRRYAAKNASHARATAMNRADAVAILSIKPANKKAQP